MISISPPACSLQGSFEFKLEKRNSRARIEPDRSAQRNPRREKHGGKLAG
jgi:hypothetical protein